MKINLEKLSTRAPQSFDKEETKKKTELLIEELDELQNLLYASAKYSVLIVVQGMDASGKDGLTNDVFGKMNPQGVRVSSFKVPTEKELNHDFLWRIHNETPEKGMIQIFNRSHYEDILVTRVHKMIDDDTTNKRMKAINDFESLLSVHNDTIIIKLYLHISPEEQQERLKERMSIPRKMWKYNAKDFEEAKKWDQYMKVYEDAFLNCNDIPWHIIPADQNWYKNFLVADLLVTKLKELDMQYPTMKPL